MYSESSYKNYIFWLKVKQIFLMILFSVIGCVLGRFIGQYAVEVLLFPITVLYISVIAGTLLFFAIAALITSGTAKEVQEAYWKIALLRKLTVISKKLDNLPQETKREVKKVVKETQNITVDKIKSENKLKKDNIKNKKVENEIDIDESDVEDDNDTDDYDLDSTINDFIK